ncbi:methionine aminotransferase [Zeaxanthinibacter sp. PT1]|uniref:methionine aminotransferase n=1 Tax=Zeaxanthinibacter TaxID=561554 RepID=UPI00234AD857|nr:methionine aminotransferase [Zeaxanthinibacter sp. PT1]MDC6350548.1 methionine aminotransferase [Zeaxanthinibacter sp. PT1]
MTFDLTSKLPGLEPSIFTVMGAMAREHNAVNLSQGFPDFEPDPELLALVDAAMRTGYNQYAPMAGIYSLREVLSKKINTLYDHSFNPDSEITVTSGATQAIFTAITAFVNPGDEVILIRPAYDCYEPAIHLNGGKVVSVQMKGKDHNIDWEEFRSAITTRTRMVIINTPHNPSGRIFSQSDMRALEQALTNTDILLLSDEVYEHLVFDGKQHESVARYPGLVSRAMICVSFGKTFHTTGWKMGYCAAPDYLMSEFRKVHEFNVYCANHPIQHALASYLEEPGRYLGLGPFFQQKRDFFLNAIAGTRFNFTPCEGTYFQLLDYSRISEETDTDFARRLITDYGLASIPISVFNENREDHRQLRFCFAKKEETLTRAAEILHKI